MHSSLCLLDTKWNWMEYDIFICSECRYWIGIWLKYAVLFISHIISKLVLCELHLSQHSIESSYTKLWSNKIILCLMCYFAEALRLIDIIVNNVPVNKGSIQAFPHVVVQHILSPHSSSVLHGIARAGHALASAGHLPLSSALAANTT